MCMCVWVIKKSLKKYLLTLKSIKYIDNISITYIYNIQKIYKNYICVQLKYKKITNIICKIFNYINLLINIIYCVFHVVKNLLLKNNGIKSDNFAIIIKDIKISVSRLILCSNRNLFLLLK